MDRMRRGVLAGTALLVCGALSEAASAAEPPGAFEGVWTGTLSAGSLRARLRLQIDASGAARMTSLDEKGEASRATRVSFAGDTLDLEFRKVFARYRARLVGDRLEGTWRQLLQTHPLTFSRGEGGHERPATVSALTPEILHAARAKARIPGLAAGWARAGQPAVVLADGFRSSEAPIPVTPQDRWHLGSITKSLTATAVARAVDQGRLRWTDTVSGVLGQTAPDMRPEYREATLLHLLSHRAGLAANLPDKAAGSFGREETPDARAERLRYARIVLQRPPVGRLAEKMSYSNAGYVVAGVMLEAACDAPWEAVVRENLYAPLGLGSGGFGPPGAPGRLDEPVGHYEPAFTWKDGRGRNPAPPGGRHPADNIAAMGPAGRAHMSLPDLMTYLAAHRDKSAGFLSARSWRTLHTPPFGGTYALGWEARSDGSLWHNGSNTLWYAEAYVGPPGGAVAAAAANDGLEDLTFPIVGNMLLAAEAAAGAA